MRWLRYYRYRVLLGALLLLVVGYPLIHDSCKAWLLFDLLLTAVFLAAFWIMAQDRLLRLPGYLLGVPTLLAAWHGYVLPGSPQTGVMAAFHLVAAAFLVLGGAAILRGILRDRLLTGDSLAGAFCCYLLMGLAFAHVYCLVEIASPGSFRADAFPLPPWHKAGELRFVMSYFSFATLTTVGYGDIQPATARARAFAMAEAILGQFYVVVVMAQLIGLRIAQATAPPDRPAGGDEKDDCTAVRP